MREYTNHHQGDCPHWDTRDGWTVVERDRYVRVEVEDEDQEYVTQTLVCLSCGVGLRRDLVILTEATTYPSARELGLGWPVEHALGCELHVSRTIFGEPDLWQVVRGGALIGLIQRFITRRLAVRFGASAYLPGSEPFVDLWTSFTDRPVVAASTPAETPLPTRAAALKWILAHHDTSQAAL